VRPPAGVAQLVEYLPSKQGVAGSSPVSRSKERRFLAELLAYSDFVRNER
jgi:hypothetical protein